MMDFIAVCILVVPWRLVAALAVLATMFVLAKLSRAAESDTLTKLRARRMALADFRAREAGVAAVEKALFQ